MPTIIPDPRPSWLHLDDPSIMDSPMIRGLRGVTNLMGWDDPETTLLDPLIAKLPKVPHPDPLVQAKRKSLAKLVSQEHMDEVLKYGDLYDEAKRAGDQAGSRLYGKRLAELDRIGRSGQPFTPSGETITSQSPVKAPASKTIMNARLRDALDALKKPIRRK